MTIRSACLAAALWVSSAATAQNFGVELIGAWNNDPGSYGDVWGEGDLAFLGKWGHPRVIILDVSDPAAPTPIATYTVPAPNGSASAQDVKTGDGLMFVVLEGGSTAGAQIVDIRNPAAPAHLTDIGVQSDTHNLFYAGGWLYLADSRNNRFDVVDLRGYDPDNAPARIDNPTYRVTGVGNTFVHDITVQGNRLYASGWDGIYVFDVSDIANSAPRFMGGAPGQSTHSAWATADGRFVVTAEERNSGGIKLYEIEESGPNATVTLRDEHFWANATVHNPLIIGDRVYCSWYGRGCEFFDIDRGSKSFVRIAAYDTGNAWGIYPFSGTRRILVGDIQNGLVVLGVGIEGDLNCDGLVDAFDIEAFIAALTDPPGYAVAWPLCDIDLADVNGDGFVDAFDIEPFIGLLVGP